MKTFIEIIRKEKIALPTDIRTTRRVQRYSTSRSVNFVLDEASLELLNATLPLKYQYTCLKKVAENIIILHREKYRWTDVSHLELKKKDSCRYQQKSFYYEKNDDDD
jgi:hypothetical protein